MAGDHDLRIVGMHATTRIQTSMRQEWNNPIVSELPICACAQCTMSETATVCPPAGMLMTGMVEATAPSPNACILSLFI